MHTCTNCNQKSSTIIVREEKDPHGRSTGRKLHICHTCDSLGFGTIRPIPAKVKTKKFRSAHI